MPTNDHVRGALMAMHRAAKSTRAKRLAETENLLKILRASAPELFRSAGNGFAVPYLDRFFDGLRDVLIDGKDEQKIELVDTRRDDVSLDEADCVSAAIASYAMTIGFSGAGDWRWHDAERRSGVKSFIVRP
jgi:hypothetical protein